jgi:hypothetical protein
LCGRLILKILERFVAVPAHAVAGSATHREIIQRQFIPAPLSVSTGSADRWRMKSCRMLGTGSMRSVWSSIWIDACKQRRFGALLDLYADDATVECRASAPLGAS